MAISQIAGQGQAVLGQQLSDPRNHLTPVQLDGGQLLPVGNPSRGVTQIEPAEPELTDDPGDLGSHRLRGAQVDGPVLDLSPESLLGGRSPSPVYRSGLEEFLPVGPFDIERLLVGAPHVP